MAYEFSSGTLRTEADHLRGVADDVTYLRSRILSLLGSAGRYSGSVNGLGSISPDAALRAGDLESRAQFLDDYQLGVVGFSRFGTVRMTATGMPMSTRAMAAAIADLQSRIDNWSGSDNDPLLDKMVRDLHELQEQLGVTPDQLAGMADAMLAGLSPTDAGLPEWLFPQWYLDTVTMHESGSALIGDLEAQRDILEERYDELWREYSMALYGGYGPIDQKQLEQLIADITSTESELDALDDSLDLAESSLVPMPVATSQTVFNHLANSPLIGYVASHEAAAEFLASQYAEAVEAQDYETVSWIAATLADPNVTGGTAAHFFNVIGVDSASDIPDFIAHTTTFGKNAVRPTAAAMPGDVIEMFAVGLSKAALTGQLDFTGVELIRSNIMRSGTLEDRYLTVYDASYLFMAGDFPKDFVVSATAEYLPYAQSPPHDMQQIYGSGGPLTLDSRVFLYEEVARHGAGAELILALDDVSDFINPSKGATYDDEAVLDAALLVLVGIPGTVTPATGLPTPEAIAATEAILVSAGQTGIAPGLEPGVALTLAPYMNVLVPGEDYDAPAAVSLRLDVDRTSPLTLSDGEVDAALSAILTSSNGADVLYQLATVYSTYELIQAEANGVPSLYVQDDLGSLFGRLRRLELGDAVSNAEATDNANAAFGMLAATGFSMLAAAAIPPSWPVVAGVLVSGAISVGGAIAFPATDHLEAVYKEAVYSLGDDVSAIQYTSLAALIDGGALQLPDGMVLPPLPTTDANSEMLEDWKHEWGDFLEEFRVWAGTSDASTLAEVPISTMLTIFALSLSWLEPTS